MQQALTVYLFCYGLMMLWHGGISDALGRKPVIVASTLVFTLVSLVARWRKPCRSSCCFCALQALSGGAGLIVGRAVIRDTLDGPAAQKLMSHVTMLFSLVAGHRPGDWRLAVWRIWLGPIFIFMALIGAALTLLAAWLFLHESHPSHACQPLQARALLANYRLVVGQREFRLLAVAVACNFSGFSVHPSALVFLMRHLGLNRTAIHLPVWPGGCGIMLGAFFSGWPGRRSRARNRLAGLQPDGHRRVSNLLYNPGCRPPRPGARCRWPATPSACRWSPHRHPFLMDCFPACARRHLLTARLHPDTVRPAPGWSCPCCGIPRHPGAGHVRVSGVWAWVAVAVRRGRV